MFMKTDNFQMLPETTNFKLSKENFVWRYLYSYTFQKRNLQMGESARFLEGTSEKVRLNSIFSYIFL